MWLDLAMPPHQRQLKMMIRSRLSCSRQRLKRTPHGNQLPVLHVDLSSKSRLEQVATNVRSDALVLLFLQPQLVAW